MELRAQPNNTGVIYPPSNRAKTMLLFVLNIFYHSKCSIRFYIVPEVPEVVLISFDSFFSSLLHLLPPFYLLPHLPFLLSLLFYSWFPPECCYGTYLLTYTEFTVTYYCCFGSWLLVNVPLLLLITSL